MGFFSFIVKRKTLGRPIELAEVDALIRHAMEKGMDPNGEIIPLLERRKSEWKKDVNNSQYYNAMLEQYSALSAKTKPISGRVLLDSENSDLYLRWLVIWTVLLMFVAAADGILKFMDTDSQLQQQTILIVLGYIGPFIWGALGACVYLLKHLYDIAGDQRFDAALFRGWWVRLVLGAVLGKVVTQIFQFTPESGTGMADLSENALAFLTGLGVRVVYGAFERTVEVLADKMNLRQARKEKELVPKDDLSTMLGEALVNVDPSAEPEKYKAILDLVRELSEKAMPSVSAGAVTELEEVVLDKGDEEEADEKSGLVP